MSTIISIRRAKPDDALLVHEIFSYYVCNSVATYHYEPPPLDFS